MTHLYQIRNDNGAIVAVNRSQSEANFESIRLPLSQYILHIEYGENGVLAAIDGKAPIDWVREIDPDFTGDDVFAVLEGIRIPLDEPSIGAIEAFNRAIAEANQEAADLGFFFHR